MYIISNPPRVYKIWSASKQKFFIKLYGEQELISFLAKFWKKYYSYYDNYYPKKYESQFYCQGYYNYFLDNFACSYKDANIIPKEYQIFDNNNKIINPMIYCYESFKYFEKNKKNFSFFDYYYYDYSPKIRKKKKQIKHNYIYRYDPVPYIHKNHKKKYFSKPQIKHLLILYSDPEYKNYLKGSAAKGQWNYHYSKSIKNWKSQSKCQHQWQRGIPYEQKL